MNTHVFGQKHFWRRLAVAVVAGLSIIAASNEIPSQYRMAATVAIAMVGTYWRPTTKQVIPDEPKD